MPEKVFAEDTFTVRFQAREDGADPDPPGTALILVDQGARPFSKTGPTSLGMTSRKS